MNSTKEQLPADFLPIKAERASSELARSLNPMQTPNTDETIAVAERVYNPDPAPNDIEEQAASLSTSSQTDRQEASALLSDWPDPEPLPDKLPPVESFDTAKLLPPVLHPWIEDIAERMQCPPDYPAVGTIVAAGSLIGRQVGIYPKRRDDWLVVPNLWGACIGRPSLMKSPALEQALRPLNQLVEEAARAYDEAMRKFCINDLIGKERLINGRKAISAALKKNEQEAARKLAEELVLGTGVAAAVERRYKTNDCTVEKLGELLRDNPNGLLLCRDELSGFLTGLDKEGREGARAFFLEAWNGTGDFTYDCIGRGTIRIKAATISIIGGIQPGVLAAYIRQALKGGKGDDGLVQRFQLAVWPDDRKDWRNVDRWPDGAAREEAFDAIKRLSKLDAAALGADILCGNIPALRFAPDAQERLDLWRCGFEPRLRSDLYHPTIEAHLAKYRKLVPALALIFHVVNGGTGLVTLAALEMALAWAKYLESHAHRIYSVAQRPEIEAARELAKHVKNGDLGDPSAKETEGDSFNLRDVYRHCWAQLETKEAAEAAAEMLVDLGWLRLIPVVWSYTGRPPLPRYAVNPKIRKG